MKSHGPWKIKDTNELYRDSFVRLWKDEVIRPDGKDGEHVVVRMKPGVCVLPIDDDGMVHLTLEFHYGIGRDSIEAVSGGIEPGENPDDTAKRELQEELGLKADDWEFLFVVNPFTTIVVSPTRLYFAKTLASVECEPEGTEHITPVKYSISQACEMVRSGLITHGPTCILLLLANERFAETTG